MAVQEVNPEQMAREKKAQEEAAKKAAEDAAKQNQNQNGDKPKKSGFWNKAGELGKKALKSPTFWGAVAKLGSLVLKAVNHPIWWGGNDQKVTGAGGMYATTNSSTKYNMVNTIGCVRLDVAKLFDLTFVENDLDRLITAFNTKVGFNTGLSVTNFKNYVQACALAYVTLLCYLRDYNGAEYKTVGAHTIGDMIDGAKYTSTNHNVISIGRDMYHYTGGADTVRREVRRTSIDSISNHEYEKIIAKLDGLKLSHNMKSFFEYLFGAFFSNGVQSGVNSLIIFDEKTNIPSVTDMGTVPTEVKYSARFAAVIANLQTAIAACPYVEAMAEALGFETINMRTLIKDDKYVINSDYTRNPIQNFINVADDDSILIALENMVSENYDSNADTFFILTHSEDLTYSTEKDRWSQKTVGEIGSWLKLFYMEADWYGLSCYAINNSYAGSLMTYDVIGKPIQDIRVSLSGSGTVSALGGKINALHSLTGYIDYHQVLGIADTDGYKWVCTVINDAGQTNFYAAIQKATNDYNCAGADVYKHTQYSLIKAENLTAIVMGLNYRQPMVEFINATAKEANKMLNR